jgi:hypothetical protein
MPKSQKVTKAKEAEAAIMKTRMRERVYSHYTRWQSEFSAVDSRTDDEKKIDEEITKLQVRNTLMTTSIVKHGKWPFDGSGTFCAKFWFSFMVYTMYNPGVHDGLKGWMQTLIFTRLGNFMSTRHVREFRSRLELVRQTKRNERLHGIFEDMHDAIKAECARMDIGSGL